MTDKKRDTDNCKTDLAKVSNLRDELPRITEEIIANCRDDQCYTHIDHESIPSKESVIDIIDRLKDIIFPGYFSNEKLEPVNLTYSMGRSVYNVFDKLSEQIVHSVKHDCLRYEQECIDCEKTGHRLALQFLETVPTIRKTLATDVRAAFEGDPAAQSYDEIIFSYPGIYAITIYRMAHELFTLNIPLLPRIMTEHAHSITGIDIHPGANIGESFVIDHGTGVVIGETCDIGNNVRLYQGVTLGALSVPKGEVQQLKGKKRHPTIETDVIVYSGATILGGDTIIGERSVIGGNVWLTKSVPPDTTVMLEAPKLIFR
jgi:serine O-acetyltransferase